MSTDDDVDGISTSSAAFLESPSKAQRERLRQKMQQEGMTGDPGSTKSLASLKKEVLRAQIASARGDDASATTEAARNERSVGTKTREQEIAAKTLSAATKPTTDQLVSQGVEDARTREDIQSQESSSEDA